VTNIEIGYLETNLSVTKFKISDRFRDKKCVTFILIFVCYLETELKDRIQSIQISPTVCVSSVYWMCLIIGKDTKVVGETT